jgi:outer membrane protein assembly factor BamB
MSVKIFFCYAREDEAILNRFKTHLRPLERQGIIEIWYDREISAGSEWEDEIHQHLDMAQIIVLLVSPDFLNSEYCYGTELKRALERHERGEAQVIPLIVRPVHWQSILGQLQVLPKDGIPITDPEWQNWDRALYNATEGLCNVVAHLTSSPSTQEKPLREPQQSIPRVETSTFSHLSKTSLLQSPIPPPPIRQRRRLNKHLLAALSVGLLIVVSGSGLFYFRSAVQGILTPAPAHAGTPTLTPSPATATPATVKQGAMFGFDAAHTHNNPYEQALRPGNISQFGLLWNFAAESDFEASPAVAGGMVYIGSYDGKFYAFDATCRRGCQPLWSFPTGRFIDSSPTVAGGMVYIGSSNGKFYAFDATCRRACQPLWYYPTGGFISSSPAVAGGMVYVGAGDGRFYTFDATCRKGCQPLWDYPFRTYVFSSPAVAGGMVYVGTGDGDRKFYAFDATCRKDCQPLWYFAAESDMLSSPAVASGTVYIGAGDGKFYAFDATCRQDCQPLWSFPTGSYISSSPTVAGGIVYIGSHNGKFYAFDATCRRDCQPIWSYLTRDGIFSSPAVAGGMVYIGSFDRNLYVFGLVP